MYVSTGKISQGAIEQASGVVDHSSTRTDFLAYDGSDCCRLFQDFRSLVPVIPYVDLTSAGNPAQTESDRGRLRAYIFAAAAKDIGSIVRQHGERLFARNIRLSKGQNAKVNLEIANGLSKTPEHFFCLNNGITVIATSANIELVSSRQYRLRVHHPQIINGQQTARTIARADKLSGKPEVLVKLICNKPESDADLRKFRDLVRTVVRATNSQTPVKMSDLASNDPEHIELERSFRLRGWRYVRKSGRIEDAHRQSWWTGRNKPYGTVTLSKLVTALVACEHDPQFMRREGIETFFDYRYRDTYDKIFNMQKRGDGEFLFAWLVFELARRKTRVTSAEKVKVERLGRYFVAYQLFALLKPLFSRREKAVLIGLGAELHRRYYSEELREIHAAVASSWQLFYRSNRERGEDILEFVTRHGSKANWRKHWTMQVNRKAKKKADIALKKFTATLTSV